MKPLCIALYAGLHGWEEGFIAEGYHCVGFDIVDMCAELGRKRPENCQLVIQDCRTLHGSQFKDATVIVASPPCQEYSYMAMPWSRAKQIIKALNGEAEFPEGYDGSHTVAELNELFDICFRIQREASVAAGRHIPMVVENVRGAQRWVGRAKANYGSFYLWGDVGMVGRRVVSSVPRHGEGVQAFRGEKFNPDGTDHPKGSWFGISMQERRGKPRSSKVPGQDWNNFKETGKVSPHWRMQLLEQRAESRKGNGSWFGDYAEAKASGRGSANRYTSSNSIARKAASAEIAKIPFPLAEHIARCFKPENFSLALPDFGGKILPLHEVPSPENSRKETCP